MHNVIFHFQSKLDSLEGFFIGIENLIEVDFSQLDTENIKSMSKLFKECSNLTKVNFDNNTPNLENINYMFFGCSSFREVKLNLNTSKVSNMEFMFYSSGELIELDLSGFNLGNLINAEYMFHDNSYLKNIKFNNSTITNNLQKMNHMFSGCKSLEYINTEIFNTIKVISLNNTFANCQSLKGIDLSHFDFKNIKDLMGS